METVKTEDSVRRANASKSIKRNWKPILIDAGMFLAKSFAAGAASAAGGVAFSTVIRRSKGRLVVMPTPNRATGT